ncbi:MAG: amidophosphoribosyltransferase [Gaiellales bacterium]|jgi:amidophosphoribosyltransferase|nr:amidophosphoribosyltransferase [Gaiellales bacterium]
MCGVFGIRASDRDVARLTYFALYALQHRGQESAGIAVTDGRHIQAVRELGLVSQVFDESTLETLEGVAAVGHARYSTTGSSRWQNAQPVIRHRPGRTLSLAHNGNLTNTTELRDELEGRGLKFESTSDTEVIAALICEHDGPLVDGVKEAMSRIVGAFAAIVMDEEQLIGFRDPDGIRPLVLGDLDGHPVLASETCALDIVGATFVRDIEPGEIVVLTDRGVESILPAEPHQPALCVFEFIYFARPDSKLDGLHLHRTRELMGERLADEAPVEADIVIPVPDSGAPAAQGFARRSGIPYVDGLVKNRYVGRTFIQPDQAMRENGIKLKFNPMPDVLAGQRVIVVDDSIVRGTTTRKIVEMLRGAGALEVHLRISSPPVISPCFYGIDMATKDEMIAANQSVEEIRQHLGADSLAYLSLEGLEAATGHGDDRYCRACLTGRYPTVVPIAADKERFEATQLPVA